MTDSCCPPGLCDCRPERVRFWLYHIKMARLSNFDPVEAAQSVTNPRGERSMGRSGPCATRNQDELVLISIMDHHGWEWRDGWPCNYTIDDIQKAARDIDGLAKALCPWAVERATIAASGIAAPRA